MISDQAHHQNLAAKSRLEAAGFKIRHDHVDYATTYKDEYVDQGKSFEGKGEQRTRIHLDRAIKAALKHQATLAPKPTSAPVVSPPPVEPLAAEKTPAQRRAVAAAIQFLVMAGAVYTIEFEGEVKSNAPVAPVKKVNDYAATWAPILKPLEGKGPFTVSITIPDEFAPQMFAVGVRAYLIAKYGRGNAITSVTGNVMEIIVAQVEP